MAHVSAILRGREQLMSLLSREPCFHPPPPGAPGKGTQFNGQQQLLRPTPMPSAGSARCGLTRLSVSIENPPAGDRRYGCRGRWSGAGDGVRCRSMPRPHHAVRRTAHTLLATRPAWLSRASAATRTLSPGLSLRSHQTTRAVLRAHVCACVCRYVCAGVCVCARVHVCAISSPAPGKKVVIF